MDNKEMFEKGQELFARNKFDESAEMFTKAMDEGYDPVIAHLSIGAAYLNNGKIDEAMHEFSQVVEIDKDNDRAYFYRGIAYMNKGDFPCAVADLSHSISLNGDRPLAFLARGVARAEAGKDDEAVEDFKQVAAYSEVERKSFENLFGSTMTSFDRTRALLEGERGPLSQVLKAEDLERLKMWLER
ncbi:MAG: tetratricopeptide repeat protein [Desulfurivibrionaceae bacterium]